jgi:hypothetical protein
MTREKLAPFPVQLAFDAQYVSELALRLGIAYRYAYPDGYDATRGQSLEKPITGGGDSDPTLAMLEDESRENVRDKLRRSADALRAAKIGLREALENLSSASGVSVDDFEVAETKAEIRKRNRQRGPGPKHGRRVR